MVTSSSHMMSLIISIFTIFLTFHIAKTQNVTRGSSLTPTGATTSWLSPSRLYAFGFYPQTRGYTIGIYIAGIPERTVVWTASRDNLPISNNATLRFTVDGGLTLDRTQDQEISIVDISGASFASMQDNGNFVLYDGTTVLWQSFDHPTDTLLTGQHLANGETLISSVTETDQSTGIFRLKMQSDGFLVQYPNLQEIPDTVSYAYWATAGYGPNNVTLNLDSGGFLYLLKNSTDLVRNLTQKGYPTGRAIYRMRIDVDGIFRLYYHNLSNTDKNGSVIWASSDNMCTGKGLCGVNGYCTVMNNAARCQCLPGFEFVNPDIWRLGCKRNFTVETCKIVDAGTAFWMTRLNNARWEGDPYAFPEAPTQQECSVACLNDCNCEVALFTKQVCKLQKLPIRFIEVVQSESNVGLVKVYASSDPSNTTTQHEKVRQTKILVIGISLISLAILILLLSGVLILIGRNHVLAYKKVSDNLNVQLFEDIGPRAFSYGELERITDGFKQELGRGSFGIVYKGIIESSKKAVAVKKIKEEFVQQGEREFQTETNVIGRTYHRNLAKLIGYCCEGRERLLVFEYMTNGSLADILFERKEGKSKPCWMDRIHIAVDIARGILYLHEECETVIIHCDIKPQNILMDEYGCAKISDFGLAKLLEHNQSKTSTLIRGTRGYVAPEWYKKLPITVKVDVYSFGIVLFSIICCRKNVDNSLPVEEAILEEWVYDCYASGEVYKLVDDEDVDKKTLDRMIKIGLWCIQEDPSLRPSMKQVVSMLEGTVKIPVPPNPYSFLSVD
uniref:G-type lectin S-receptor-like serine/threonine-protein kinase LECRK1 n=1 Tax=Erigeron canadensis TaxID=72917 RepID=UPI001CB9403A|nr:G-type lectin S-receptor-like serine/threonine-protein kinase LECRK1 [Erigeron canadensis]